MGAEYKCEECGALQDHDNGGTCDRCGGVVSKNVVADIGGAVAGLNFIENVPEAPGGARHEGEESHKEQYATAGAKSDAGPSTGDSGDAKGQGASWPQSEGKSESSAANDNLDEIPFLNENGICALPENLKSYFNEFPSEVLQHFSGMEKLALSEKIWMFWVLCLLLQKSKGHAICMLLGAPGVGKGQYVRSMIKADCVAEYRKAEVFYSIVEADEGEEAKADKNVGHILEGDRSRENHVAGYPFVGGKKYAADYRKMFLIDHTGETFTRNAETIQEDLLDPLKAKGRSCLLEYLKALFFSLGDSFLLFSSLDCKTESAHPYFDREAHEKIKLHRKFTHGAKVDARRSTTQAIEGFKSMMAAGSRILDLLESEGKRVDFDSIFNNPDMMPHEALMASYLSYCGRVEKDGGKFCTNFTSNKWQMPFYCAINKAEIYKEQTAGAIDPEIRQAEDAFKEFHTNAYKILSEEFVYYRFDWLSAAYPAIYSKESASKEMKEDIENYPYPGLRESFEWLWENTMFPDKNRVPTNDVRGLGFREIFSIMNPLEIWSRSNG